MYDDGEVEAGNQTAADCGKHAEGLTFLLIGPFLRLKKNLSLYKSLVNVFTCMRLCVGFFLLLVVVCLVVLMTYTMQKIS